MKVFKAICLFMTTSTILMCACDGSLGEMDLILNETEATLSSTQPTTTTIMPIKESSPPSPSTSVEPPVVEVALNSTTTTTSTSTTTTTLKPDDEQMNPQQQESNEIPEMFAEVETLLRNDTEKTQKIVTLFRMMERVLNKNSTRAAFESQVHRLEEMFGHEWRFKVCTIGAFAIIGVLLSIIYIPYTRNKLLFTSFNRFYDKTVYANIIKRNKDSLMI